MPNKNQVIGQMWRLTPVIPTLWEAEAGGSRGQEFKTSLGNIARPHLYKNFKKLAEHGDVHLWFQLLRRLRQENRLNPGGRGCSELRLHHCSPAWGQSETPSKKKKKTIKTKKTKKRRTETWSDGEILK